VGIGPTLFGHLVQCGIEGAENAEPENAGPENDGPNWIFVNLSILDNSPCGSEVASNFERIGEAVQNL
jgi:hypothetical protein